MFTHMNLLLLGKITHMLLVQDRQLLHFKLPTTMLLTTLHLRPLQRQRLDQRGGLLPLLAVDSWGL